jgi:RNA polymerase sigma-70 factor (ECF subfamily)
LVEAVQHDERFWQRAYQAHASAVLAYLRRRTGRGEEAEDLLQETFLRAMGAASFREGNLRGYLMTIARNLLISRVRRPRLAISDVTADQATETEPSRDISPEREVALRSFRDRLDGVLAGMNSDQRTAFEMGVLEQTSYPEIARLTGWNLSTVKVRIFRARRRIIDVLGDELRGLRGRPS